MSTTDSEIRRYGLGLLRSCADRLDAGIVTGNDWPNSQEELDRLQSARLLRESATEIQNLREWAKLAFRVLNHVGPLMLTLESETSAEQDLTDKLREMAEAVARQYMPIAGVDYTDAMKDARTALGES